MSIPLNEHITEQSADEAKDGTIGMTDLKVRNPEF